LTGPVIVCADRSPAHRRALRWAAAAARRRRTALDIVIPARPDAQPPSRRLGVLATVLGAVPGRAVRGGVADALRRRSTEAGALVVPATLPDVAAVVADAHCPVAVVPAAPEVVQGPVVLAAAPWTGDCVVELAFAEASDLRAPLRAVRAWTEPRIDLGLLRPVRSAEWDGAGRDSTEWDSAEERVQHELDIALSPWRFIHPEVDLQAVAVQDRAAGLLVALSRRARLVIVGRSERGAFLGGFSESPVTALLRAAHCPILVVPAEGPPRTAWLPGRDRGWAFTAR